ncbi:hypothetical protein R9D66_004273 [Citrobacter amalonaticus]|nr:hypothetical protein [Citrobacter amalonaticus]
MNRKNVKQVSYHSALKGYKLEPIINIDNGGFYAYELLSFLSEEINIERLFSMMSIDESWKILQDQFNLISGEIKNTQIFVNAPCAIFFDVNKVLSIIDNHPPNVNIELQDPENMFLLNDNDFSVLVSNLKLLKSSGVPIWLDDLQVIYTHKAVELSPFITGIKVDKYEFWNAYFKKNVQDFLLEFSTISSNIIIEGIENENHLKSVATNHGFFGQGYQWPRLIIRK